MHEDIKRQNQTFMDQVSAEYDRLYRWFLHRRDLTQFVHNASTWFKEGQDALARHEREAIERILLDLKSIETEDDASVKGFWGYLGKKYDAENLTQRVDEALKNERWMYLTRYGAQVLYTAVTKLAIVMSTLKIEPLLTSADTPYGMTKPLPDMSWIEEESKNPDLIVHRKEERKVHLMVEKAAMYPLMITMLPFIMAEAAEASTWVHHLFTSMIGAHATHAAIGLSVGAGLVSVAILQWGMVVLTGIELSHAAKKSTLEGMLEDRVIKLSEILTRLEDKTAFIESANREKLILQKNELEKEINSALKVANAIIQDPANNKRDNGFEWSDQPITQVQVDHLLEPLKQHYKNYDENAPHAKVNLKEWNQPNNLPDKVDELRVGRVLEKQRRSYTGLLLSLFGYIALAVGATLLAAVTIIGAPVALPVIASLVSIAPTALIVTGLGLNVIASITNRWDRRDSHLDREALFLAELDKLLPEKAGEKTPRSEFIEALKAEMAVEVGARQKDRGVLSLEMMESVKDDYELFQVLDANRKAWPTVLKNTVLWNTEKEGWIKEFTDFKAHCTQERTESIGFFGNGEPRKTPEELAVIDKIIDYLQTGKKECFSNFSEQGKTLISLFHDKDFVDLIRTHKDILPAEFMQPWREAYAQRDVDKEIQSLRI